MNYPTKYQQWAFQVGMYIAGGFTGIVAGCMLGWAVAKCFRLLAGVM